MHNPQIYPHLGSEIDYGIMNEHNDYKVGVVYMSCPSCGFEYTYEDNGMMVCSACQYSWDPAQLESENKFTVKDANNNILVDGDDVIVIKDLKVKGSSSVIKQGTKVTGIRLIEDAKDGHDIDCKIKDFGQMKLKSEFVKKAN